jgi:hypothetical protein
MKSIFLIHRFRKCLEYWQSKAASGAVVTGGIRDQWVTRIVFQTEFKAETYEIDTMNIANFIKCVK